MLHYHQALLERVERFDVRAWRALRRENPLLHGIKYRPDRCEAPCLDQLRPIGSRADPTVDHLGPVGSRADRPVDHLGPNGVSPPRPGR